MEALPQGGWRAWTRRAEEASIGPGLGQRLRRGVLGNGAATAFMQASVLVGQVVVANLLGREAFGQFNLVFSTVATLSAVAGLATGLTATKYAAEFRRSDPAAAERVLGMCLGVAIVSGVVAAGGLLLASPVVAEQVFQDAGLTRELVLAAGYVLFTVVNGYQTGALAGLEAYPAMARAALIVALLHVALVSGSTWLWGLAGATGALALSASVRWWVYSRALARALRHHGLEPSARALAGPREVLWRFTLLAALGGLSAMPALWLGNLILAQQPQGYAKLGVYGAAGALRAAVLMLPLLFNTVGTSLLNERRGARDQHGYRRVYWFNLGATFALAAVAAGLTFAAAPVLLRAFGPAFADGARVLGLLLFSTVPESLSVAAYQSVQSQGRMWLSLFAVSLPRDGAFVLLALWLVPRAGAEGLAMAYLLSWCLALAAILAIVRRLGLAIHASGESHAG